MGHEHSLVDEFLAIGFVCIFLYHLNQAMQKASGIDWDNIELFRITDIYAKDCELKTNQSTVDNSRTETKKRQTQNKKKKTQKKKKQKKPEERNSNGYTALQQDCFDALSALGFKYKKEKQFILNKTFNEHKPATVEEFISLVFK